jgi:hypothetical protein
MGVTGGAQSRGRGAARRRMNGRKHVECKTGEGERRLKLEVECKEATQVGLGSCRGD